MSDGDLSALLTFLAIPAGGLIAAGILWAMLRPPKGVTMNTDPTLKPDIAALQKRLAEDPGFAAEVTGDRLPTPGCHTPDGCRENGCLGWCDEHRPDRPPTPVGWSDTDWLKHLEEIQQDQAVYHRGPLPETGWD